jgi:hypothetical protein
VCAVVPTLRALKMAVLSLLPALCARGGALTSTSAKCPVAARLTLTPGPWKAVSTESAQKSSLPSLRSTSARARSAPDLTRSWRTFLTCSRTQTSRPNSDKLNGYCVPPASTLPFGDLSTAVVSMIRALRRRPSVSSSGFHLASSASVGVTR